MEPAPDDRRKRAVICAVPSATSKREILGYHHKLVMISVVGTGLTLPLDVEPYGPGDSEYSAGRRLLRRAVGNLGRRFADYVVADGDYATAPFLHDAGDLGLSRRRPLEEQSPRIVRGRPEKISRASLPIKSSATGRTGWKSGMPTTSTLGKRCVGKRCGWFVIASTSPTARSCEAYWLTDFPRHRVSSRAIFRMAKSRWEIENQGFNDAKNRYGFEHICHHERHSLLVVWLLARLSQLGAIPGEIRCGHRGNS